MPTTTPNLALTKPDRGAANWDTTLNGDLDTIDTQFGPSGAAPHDHSGVAGKGPKLAQANTHQSADTDVGPTSLHHTLGVGANQAAAGNHTHAGNVSPPRVATFTWVNQGSAVATDVNEGLILSTAAGNGNLDSFHCLVQTLPTTPWVAQLDIRETIFNAHANDLAGLVLQNSTGGTLITFCLRGTLSTGGAPQLAIDNWNSPTSWNSVALSTVSLQRLPVALRVSDDGTNRTYAISCDGHGFLTVLTTTSSAFLTPDKCGLGISNYANPLVLATRQFALGATGPTNVP